MLLMQQDTAASAIKSQALTMQVETIYMRIHRIPLSVWRGTDLRSTC